MRKRMAIVPIGPSIAYIPLTKGMYSLVEVEDVALLECSNWSVAWKESNRAFYAARGPELGGKPVERYMHTLITGQKPTDHANRNTLDNRRHGNLRGATRSQNQANMKRRTVPNSGFVGVYAMGSGWKSCMSLGGRQINTGVFSDKIAAARARDCAVYDHFGRYAVLNFPDKVGQPLTAEEESTRLTRRTPTEKKSRAARVNLERARAIQRVEMDRMRAANDAAVNLAFGEDSQ